MARNLYYVKWSDFVQVFKICTVTPRACRRIYIMLNRADCSKIAQLTRHPAGCSKIVQLAPASAHCSKFVQLPFLGHLVAQKVNK